MRWPPPARAARPAVVAVAVCALVAAVAVTAVRGAGYAPARVAVSGGTAWLASPAAQLITLVDGPSELVVGNVRIAGRGAAQVVQVGASALLVDRAGGTVSRVDGATYDVSAPVGFAAPVDVVVGAADGYVIDGGGTASAVDPASLQVRGGVPLGGVPQAGQAVVDADGRLWAVPGTAGGLVGLGPSGRVVRSTGVAASARLAVVQGRPVVVDLEQGRAGRVGADAQVTSWSCFPAVPPDGTQVLGSAAAPHLYAAVPGTGAVVVVDLDGPGCGTTVPVGRPGDVLGPMVEASRFVLVPNRTTGRVGVVDVDTGTLTDDLQVLPDPVGRLELLAQGGLVFYNDLESDRAGVLDVEGRRWRVGAVARKFVETDAGAEPVRLLETGSGAIPPDRPPANLPPPRGMAGGAGPPGQAPPPWPPPAPQGPAPSPVPEQVPEAPAPRSTGPTPRPTTSTPPAQGPVVTPDFDDLLHKQLSAVRGTITSRIAKACGGSRSCLTIATAIEPVGETFARVPPCTISKVPTGGRSVPRGSALTFTINEPCDADETTTSPTRPPTTRPPPDTSEPSTTRPKPGPSTPPRPAPGQQPDAGTTTKAPPADAEPGG